MAMALTQGGNSAFHNFHNDYAHIADPNERRRLALAEIEKAPLGCYHVRSVLVTGMGFLADSYGLFSISVVTSMLGVIYWHNDPVHPGTIPISAETAMKVATLAGVAIGQLGFGLLSDVLGRKKSYCHALLVVMVATLAHALSARASAIPIVAIMVFWRLMMGIGIGAGYPLAATITSEFAPTRWRGSMIASVFAMQGFGQLAASLVPLLATAAFKKSLSGTTSAECNGQCLVSMDRMWRIVVGVGVLPSLLVMYYRFTIPETPRYTFDVAHDGIQDLPKTVRKSHRTSKGSKVTEIHSVRTSSTLVDDAAKGSVSDFLHYYSRWEHIKVLLGAAGCWFALDMALFGINFNSDVILEALGMGVEQDLYTSYINTALGNLLIISAGAIPGHWATAALIDFVGRRPLQTLGFSISAILFAILGFGFHAIGRSGQIACFVLVNFFLNFGPNVTTFVAPAECFPTRYRSTSYGISAATGKLGAIIAQLLMSSHISHATTLKIFALVTLLGAAATWLVPETKRKTLEELSGEMVCTVAHVGDAEQMFWEKHSHVSSWDEWRSERGSRWSWASSI